MKSSTGRYFQSLDHLRAFAAFLVVVWHFNHFKEGQLEGPLVFPIGMDGRNRVPTWLAAAVGLAFLIFWTWFDSQGGLHGAGGRMVTSTLWIIIPTIEALAYATLILWYDRRFPQIEGRISAFVASIGTWSYSIYLLHRFFLPRLQSGIDSYIVPLDNPYVRLVAALGAFIALIPVACASYYFIERPCLRFRTRYIMPKVIETDLQSDGFPLLETAASAVSS